MICRKDIERSTKTFWIKKGHLLCSTCLDNIDKDKKNLDNIKVWDVKGILKSYLKFMLSNNKTLIGDLAIKFILTKNVESLSK